MSFAQNGQNTRIPRAPCFVTNNRCKRYHPYRSARSWRNGNFILNEPINKCVAGSAIFVLLNFWTIASCVHDYLHKDLEIYLIISRSHTSVTELLPGKIFADFIFGLRSLLLCDCIVRFIDSVVFHAKRIGTYRMSLFVISAIFNQMFKLQINSRERKRFKWHSTQICFTLSRKFASLPKACRQIRLCPHRLRRKINKLFFLFDRNDTICEHWWNFCHLPKYLFFAHKRQKRQT